MWANDIEVNNELDMISVWQSSNYVCSQDVKHRGTLYKYDSSYVSTQDKIYKASKCWYSMWKPQQRKKEKWMY